MLILTRRVGEKIMIGEDVSVIVLAVKGRQVSLGFDAPEDVSILREEIYQGDLKNTNKTSSTSIKKIEKTPTIITKRKKKLIDEDLYCFARLNAY